MTWRSYLAALRQTHREALAATAAPGPVEQKLNLILAAAFALVALVLVAVGGYRTGFEPVHGFGQHFPARFTAILTSLGDTNPSICLAALLARRRPKVLWMGVLASVYAALLTLTLKTYINADRPSMVLGETLTVIGPVWRWHSFPSGHTVTAFILAACLSSGRQKSITFLLYALAAAVGASRVWAGVHWPVDVLAGAAVAGASVALAIQTTKFIDWGLRLAPHLCFVSVAAGSAVVGLVSVPEYPQAAPLSVSIAVISLCILARDYGLEPLGLVGGKGAGRVTFMDR